MAGKLENYTFVPGKTTKNTGTVKGNPGILMIDGQRKFLFHKHNKSLDILDYRCANSLTQGPAKCYARAKVGRVFKEDGSFTHFLAYYDSEHSCEIHESKVIADEMREKMKAQVRRNPEAAVGEAIRAVQFEYSQKYGDSDDLWPEIIAYLGNHASLEMMLYRIRTEVIGKSPKHLEL